MVPRKERLRQRQHRIFVSLLWSDPVGKPTQRGPSKRGAGAFFDSKVTQEPGVEASKCSREFMNMDQYRCFAATRWLFHAVLRKVFRRFFFPPFFFYVPGVPEGEQAQGAAPIP